MNVLHRHSLFTSLRELATTADLTTSVIRQSCGKILFNNYFILAVDRRVSGTHAVRPEEERVAKRALPRVQ